MIAVPQPDIDFRQIRTHEGSRHTGFEELCAQLAALEPRPEKSEFERKGRGGDAGIECLVRASSGDERGWQAKYIFEWDGVLVAQLDKSIGAALDKHSRLTEFVVCLPFDLPDARPVRGKSARQKWDAWKEKWEKTARNDGRELKISLWGLSEIAGLLATDSPAHAGRLAYWFDQKSLTSAWFSEQFDKAQASLGSRYTPDTNVELPIRRGFLAFARDPFLEREITRWSSLFVERGRDFMRAFARFREGVVAAPMLDSLSGVITALAEAFSRETYRPDEALPIDSWKAALDACQPPLYEALRWIYDLPLTDSREEESDRSWARQAVFRLSDALGEVGTALESDEWSLVNANAVLLEGTAGSGKSHLLADIAEHQIHSGRPAILVLGSWLVDDEPWRQILSSLDLPVTLQVKTFLGSMDAAGEAAGVKALICVDAINERHGTDIWPDRLAAFLKAAEAFPHVGIILSCRTTYLDHVVPETIDSDRLARISHRGFADRGGAAANLYLERRGIIRPGAPNLVPEFLNPLFLKTCCDYLDREGKRELPRGLRGVTAIFAFYNLAVTRAITRRMKLDRHLDLVGSALDRFASMLVERGSGYADKAEVIAAFEEILPSGGNLERSLLAQFESEGILAVEPVGKDDGTPRVMVRFTFERYSDHEAAAHLLANHIPSGTDVRDAFMSGTRLGELVFGDRNYRHAGIIEAIAVQLPEGWNVEIVELRSEWDWTVQNAFQESLLWREQEHFTERTFELVSHLQNEDEVRDLLVTIATEPSNKFNADYLDGLLRTVPMPERDACWTAYLNSRGEEGDPVHVLIEWANGNGFGAIEEERARLAVTVLAWFLASSNRKIRDTATKALVSLFAKRLDLARKTILSFAKVDDLYVQERLFAAAYGAVLQEVTTDGLTDLVGAIFEEVFSAGSPPPNELLRDHARGIIDFAARRGALPVGMELAQATPPHRSPWPIEYVPDALIEGYRLDPNGERIGDAIVSSTINDGDFARYIVDHKIDKWAPVPIGSPTCPSSKDIALEWIERFKKSATDDQFEAFLEYAKAAKAAHGKRTYPETPEQKALKDAEAALQESLPDDLWEEFRVSTKNYLQHWHFSDHSRASAARFDAGWARRWICKRAHDFGWTAERFGNLDKNSTYERHNHKVERIGKKYQWLALHELIARMADNLLFIGSSYSEREPLIYEGPAEIDLRDIDPSMLLAKTYFDGWEQWPQTWWIPVEPRLKEITPLERLAWLESEQDLLNDHALIDRVDPKTGAHWLMLNGFASWRQSGHDGDNRAMQRETWYRVRCIVTKKRNRAKVKQSLIGRCLIDSHILPEFHLDSSCYLGEYPWHSSIATRDKWVRPDQWNKLGAPVSATTSHYYRERAGYDYSIEESFRIELPAPWLAEAMGLRIRSGQEPVFVDESGEIKFFDPSVSAPGFQVGMVDRDAFLGMLEREGLSAIWVIAGEKGTFGGDELIGGFGGRLMHTGVYAIEAGRWSRSLYHEREKPVPDQLRRFLGFEPSEVMLAEYTRPDTETG